MLVLAVVAMAASAQRERVISFTSDTIQGAETVTFAEFSTTGSYNTITIEMLCSELGGTSDGTLTLYGSLDGTNFVFVNGVGGLVIASPKASNTGTDLNQLTITDALVASWVVQGSPYDDWKVLGVGDTGDTTLVSAIKVVLK